MKFFALASVAAAFAIYAPSPLKSCGTSQDSFALNFLDLNPYPVTKGGNVTVKAAGILNKDITQGASVSLTVKAGFIPLYSTTVDLCDNASEQGMACPIPKVLKHNLNESKIFRARRILRPPKWFWI